MNRRGAEIAESYVQKPFHPSDFCLLSSGSAADVRRSGQRPNRKGAEHAKESKSLTAKIAEVPKENNSHTAKIAEDAKESPKLHRQGRRGREDIFVGVNLKAAEVTLRVAYATLGGQNNS